MTNFEGRTHNLVFESEIIANNSREHTGVLAGLGLDRGRISIAGRDSDIRPLNTGERDDTDTFAFNIPAREVTVEPSSPLPYIEDSALQVGDDQGVEEVEEEELGSPELEQELDDEIVEEDEDSVDEIGAEEEETSILQDIEGDVIMAMTEEVETAALKSGRITKRKKKVKVSKHGLQYPSLPAGVVKKLATTFARTAGNSKAKFSKDALDAIMQASDWFFEQASEDLSAYAGHAGRKTIEESDVLTLMTRSVS